MFLHDIGLQTCFMHCEMFDQYCSFTPVTFQQSSLEDLLRVLEEDAPYRSRLPLSGLIGRKMGLQTLDLISELRRRNLRHVLALILSQLTPADIYRCGNTLQHTALPLCQSDSPFICHTHL